MATEESQPGKKGEYYTHIKTKLLYHTSLIYTTREEIIQQKKNKLFYQNRKKAITFTNPLLLFLFQFSRRFYLR